MQQMHIVTWASAPIVFENKSSTHLRTLSDFEHVSGGGTSCSFLVKLCHSDTCWPNTGTDRLCRNYCLMTKLPDG